jgi:septal ring factor EnvC (AmiA/AmiB activator)
MMFRFKLRPHRLINIRASVKQYTGVFLCATLSLYTPQSAASQEELKGVSNEISRQQQSLTTRQKELNALQATLKKEELAISKLASSINQTEQKLKQANQNLTTFSQQKSGLEETRQAQTEVLQTLLRTYYLTQQHGKAASAIVDKGDNAKDERVSYFYQHLAKERAQAIKNLSLTTEQLQLKNQQLVNEQQQVAALLAKQKSERDTLAQSQRKKKQTVAKYQTSIKSDKTYLAELQRNETRLKAEIAKAAKRNAVPMDGIEKQKGRLPWPLEGKILTRYGSPQAGQVSWKGMVIDASYEEPVKAVYSGTVVFAEYLRGYGLVVLLDHGKGDMTLYGYNQVLMKNEGDKVAAGEVIALAGDTGGQNQPSLYFEIRRNSKTQNPINWLTR